MCYIEKPAIVVLQSLDAAFVIHYSIAIIQRISFAVYVTRYRHTAAQFRYCLIDYDDKYFIEYKTYSLGAWLISVTSRPSSRDACRREAH